MKINFLTTNTTKFNNARRFFDGVEGYELVQHSFETPEIQEESCESIARFSAAWAARELGEPCVKMDVGFFISSLNGFPGPFVKYVNDKLTAMQLLMLLKDTEDRSAYFQDSLAIGYPDGASEVFTTETHGKLLESVDVRNSRWPVDSIFMPAGFDKTLDEMTAEERKVVWTNSVWEKLIAYLSSK